MRVLVDPQPPAECSIHYMLGDESWLPLEKRTHLRHYWEAWWGPLFQGKPDHHLAGGHEAPCPFGATGLRDRVRVKRRGDGLWEWIMNTDGNDDEA